MGGGVGFGAAFLLPAAFGVLAVVAFAAAACSLASARATTRRSLVSSTRASFSCAECSSSFSLVLVRRVSSLLDCPRS